MELRVTVDESGRKRIRVLDKATGRLAKTPWTADKAVLKEEIAKALAVVNSPQTP